MAKDWAEKEIAYEDAYRAGRTARSLWEYIPTKYIDAIDWMCVDSDGYWVWLVNGYTAYDHGEDCGVIHEYTIADIKEALKTIQKGVV